MEKEHIPQIEPESLTIVNQDGILDLLDREQYVGNIMQILNVISDEKGSCTLAINGKWGSGKTFLLDKLEYNLKRYRDQEQYLVFHYNCWQYDYYDEPLIAIVSSMIDGMNSVERILPEKISKNLLAAIKTFSGIIFDVAKEGSINFIKEKTGIDVGEIHKRFKSERALISKHKQEIAFDDYKTFNMVMTETRKKLSLLADDITLVFVVDEMDRCLPTYAIKVMERVHHLFYGLKNTASILSVDKEQLENTIKQIYGNNTLPDEYLKKFIDYEISLDSGTINDKFIDKYPNYVSLFDATAVDGYFSIEDFYSALFDGIDIRTQEHLIQRIKTIHRILYLKEDTIEKKDYSFMCFELLLVYFNHMNIHTNPIHFIGQEFEWRLKKEKPFVKFNEYIVDLWKCTDYSRTEQMCGTGNSRRQIVVFENNSNVTIPHLIFWYLFEFFKNNDSHYLFHINGVIELNTDYTSKEKYSLYIEEFKKINDLLNIVK